MPRGSPRLRSETGAKNLVGKRVRERRRELNSTQDALCGRIAEVTSGHWTADRLEILRIENGTKGVLDLELLALAAALECDACWLLGLSSRMDQFGALPQYGHSAEEGLQ